MENSIVNSDGKVFDSCDALFVFPNKAGSLSIKQYSIHYGDEVIIEIPLHFVEKTISALRLAKREAEDLKDA